MNLDEALAVIAYLNSGDAQRLHVGAWMEAVEIVRKYAAEAIDRHERETTHAHA